MCVYIYACVCVCVCEVVCLGVVLYSLLYLLCEPIGIGCIYAYRSAIYSDKILQ